MLKQRIVTAVLLAIVVVGTIVFAEHIWVRLLFTLVLGVAVQELLNLTLKLSPSVKIILTALFTLLFWFSLDPVQQSWLYWQSVGGAFLWLLITLSLFFYRHQGDYSLLIRILLLGLGLDLIWICCHGLIYLHQENGAEMLLFLFTLVWIADIGAYFSGRRFGKHKLAPLISPGKTWEGVAGGVLLNLIWIMLIFQVFDGWGIPLIAFVSIAVATSAISVVGDLFESILKREAGVKDSGRLLPGHGGVLDRIDGVIAATPVFVAGVMMVNAV
ncbi:MAG: phosphatidate cytidylyltransferase [Pseudomonadota bacterium]